MSWGVTLPLQHIRLTQFKYAVTFLRCYLNTVKGLCDLMVLHTRRVFVQFGVCRDTGRMVHNEHRCELGLELAARGTYSSAAGNSYCSWVVIRFLLKFRREIGETTFLRRNSWPSWATGSTMETGSTDRKQCFPPSFPNSRHLGHFLSPLFITSVHSPGELALAFISIFLWRSLF